MANLLGQMLPAALVGALAVLPITIVITLLMSKGGLGKALGFGVGLVGVFTVIGVITLATASTNAGSSDTGSAVTGTIVAVLGGVLLVVAIKQLVDAPDPDAPPPKLMTRLDSMSAVGAAVLGIVIGLTNIKQLGIYAALISQIVAADISTAQGWVALIVLLVVLQIGVIGPILVYILARDWATRALRACHGWLIKNNRTISIVLSLVVGVWFIIKGITQIAG
jgi:cytochrome c biogenesis protein CcdA